MNYDYMTPEKCEEVANRAAQALATYCIKENIHFVVTGVSGGLDSAVVMALAERACQYAKEKDFDLFSVGLMLPCQSTQESVDLGREVIKKFGAYQIFYNLTSVYQDIDTSDLNGQIYQILKETVGKKGLDHFESYKKIAEGNIKARLRMMLGTYNVAGRMGGIVLSTDNLSEFLQGFWTLLGDVGDFGMIQQIWKGVELYRLAKHLHVPQAILDAVPDDGLGIGKGDADQLGAEYPQIDELMIQLMKEDFDPDGSMDQMEKFAYLMPEEWQKKVTRRALKTSFKRKGQKNLARPYLGLPKVKEI